MTLLKNKSINMATKAVAKLQTTYLSKVEDINPYTERMCEVFTVSNADGVDFFYSLKHRAYDKVVGNYEQMCNLAHLVGQELVNKYPTPGMYLYKVKLTIAGDYLGYMIVETDNPRCILGDRYTRKDVTTLALPSQFKLSGYSISGRIASHNQLLDLLSKRLTIVHSNTDIKRLVKALSSIKPVLSLELSGTSTMYDLTKPSKSLPVRPKWFPEYNSVETRVTPIGIRLVLHNTDNLPLQEMNTVVDIDEVIVGIPVTLEILDRVTW